MQGNRSPGGRTVWDIGADMIPFVQFSRILKLQDRHRGKLSRRSPGQELGSRGVVDLPAPVRHAIALAEQDRVTLRQQHRAAELVLLRRLVKYVSSRAAASGRTCQAAGCAAWVIETAWLPGARIVPATSVPAISNVATG